MIKRGSFLLIAFTLALVWTTGCSTLSSLGSSKTKTSTPKKGLYANVPASMRAPVKEATFDFKKAQADAKLATEKVKLAELQKERAILEKELADYNQILANTTVQKAEVTIERKKLEAIDNANLGDKASNIKEIAKLRTQELNIEADCVNTRASMATIELEIKKLDQKVKQQRALVSGNKQKRKGKRK